MRNSNEMADEILRRVTALEARAARYKRVVACVCCLIAAAGIVFAAAQQEEAAGIGHTTATSLPPLAFEAAGGYVLVGVICFVVGTSVALLCIRIQKQKEAADAQDKKDSEGR